MSIMLFDEIVRQHHGDKTGFARHYLTLYSLVLGVEAKQVFEFGAGFSSRVIMAALEHTGGTLLSCDTRPMVDTGLVKETMMELNDHWRYVQRDSRELVPQLTDDEAFDLVLHDGSHNHHIVSQDLKGIIGHIRQGGLLLVHDTEHPSGDFKLQRAVRRATRWVKHSQVTMPYGYGLTIIRIEKDFGHGRVKPSWQKAKVAA